jgi:glycosyltransferase involved in cell wall biosynthesis
VKRIGFILHANQNDWLGGLSYFRNLLRAVFSNPGRGIEPVLLLPPGFPEETLAGFPEVETITTPLASHRHPTRLAGRIASKVLGRDLALESLLQRRGIEALSHSGVIGSRSEIPAISWIPDFQHLRMPDYFSRRELDARNNHFSQLASKSSRVILSSNDAQRDFASFAPHAQQKARVLHFVSWFENIGLALSREELEARFGIDRPYFHLPNQFWAHKNHEVVIEAIGILQRRGVNVLVLATGKTEDYRKAGHFLQLMGRVKELGIDDNFRPLGVVKLPELQSLMLNALALINPSNFEGWSTTVEESKSLGLPIILSDIAVHVEQAPRLGHYFKAGSPEDLADVMLRTMRERDPLLLEEARQSAAVALPCRIRQFGEAYEEIVMSAIDDCCELESKE